MYKEVLGGSIYVFIIHQIKDKFETGTFHSIYRAKDVNGLYQPKKDIEKLSPDIQRIS